MRRPIGEKWQVVIPKDIREFLSLRKRENVVFEARENEVVIKAEQDPEEFLKEFFSIARPKKKKGSIKEIKKIIYKQYDEEIPR